MLVDGISLIEGSDFANLVVDSGTTFPSSPNIGELFYKTTAPIGLHTYDGTAWTAAGAGGSATPGGLTNSLQFNDGGALGGSTTMYISGSTLTVGAVDTTFTLTTPPTNVGGQTAGAILIQGGTYAQTSSAGGHVTLQGGTHAGLGGTGGNANLVGGTGIYNGGNAVVRGGAGSGESYTNNPGGHVLINGGLASGTGVGGYISLSTAPAASLVERLRILNDGAWQLSGSAGTAGQVLTSAGASGTPTWSSSFTVAESSITDANILTRVAGNEVITGTWTFNNVVAGVMPSADTHLATKLYVDNVASGLQPKASVRVATTGNITLSGTQTIDGVAVVVGNRVLVKNQTTTTQNGIYVVNAGAWTRSTDADDSPDGEVSSGMYTLVTSGTASTGVGYVLVTDDPITLGVTALTFTAFSSAAGPAAAGTLTGATLASNVLASSLTSVGNLTALNVRSGSSAAGVLTVGTTATVFTIGAGVPAGAYFGNAGAGDVTFRSQNVAMHFGTDGAGGNSDLSIATTGAISFNNGGSGTAGQVLTSTGNSPPSWQPATASTLQNATVLGTVAGTNTSITGVNGTGSNTMTIKPGAATDGAGIGLIIQGGVSWATNAGGPVTISGGQTSSMTGQAAGTVTIHSDGGAIAVGGQVSIRGGNSSLNGGSQIGGSVSISGGNATNVTTSGIGGNVSINGGLSLGAGGGTGGAILFTTAASGLTPVERFRILNNGAWSVGSAGTNVGTAGQVLTSAGSGASPTWSAVAAVATQIPRATSFTQTSADIGKRIVISSSPTIPAAVFVAGDVISFYNNTATSITIIQGGGLTMRHDGTLNTGNRTLAPYGTCVVWFDSASACVITGSIT